MRAVLFVASLSVAGLASLSGALAAPPPLQARDQFLARCRGEILAAEPNAERWVDEACEERWTAVARSNPMVDALLSLFKTGTPAALDPADVRARAPMVRWRSATEGQLGPLWVETTRDPSVRLVIGWSATGEPVPYDPAEALRVRGAEVVPIGCYAFGAGESNTVWRVAAPGHVPFALTVYRREAPTGAALSHLTVSVNAERDIPDLAALRAAEPEPDWRPRCD